MNYTTFGAFWTKNARQNMLLDIIAPDNPKSNASRQCSRKYPCGGLQCVLAVLDGSLTGDCLLLRKLGHCCIRCNAEGSRRGFGIPCEVHLGVIGTGGEIPVSNRFSWSPSAPAMQHRCRSPPVLQMRRCIRPVLPQQTQEGHCPLSERLSEQALQFAC